MKNPRSCATSRPLLRKRQYQQCSTCTISSVTRECLSSPNCSQISRTPGRVSCSGAWTSWHSTRKLQTSPVRIDCWPSSNSKGLLTLIFLSPAGTSWRNNSAPQSWRRDASWSPRRIRRSSGPRSCSKPWRLGRTSWTPSMGSCSASSWTRSLWRATTACGSGWSMGWS